LSARRGGVSKKGRPEEEQHGITPETTADDSASTTSPSKPRPGPNGPRTGAPARGETRRSGTGPLGRTARNGAHPRLAGSRPARGRTDHGPARCRAGRARKAGRERTLRAHATREEGIRFVDAANCTKAAFASGAFGGQGRYLLGDEITPTSDTGKKVDVTFRNAHCR
jgi:hypothetical protein